MKQYIFSDIKPGTYFINCQGGKSLKIDYNSYVRLFDKTGKGSVKYFENVADNELVQKKLKF